MISIWLGSAIGVAIVYGIAILSEIKSSKKERALWELRLEEYDRITRPEYGNCKLYSGTKSTLRQIINSLEDEKERNYLLSCLNSIEKSGDDYTNFTVVYYPESKDV